jgi:hypothetical protein
LESTVRAWVFGLLADGVAVLHLGFVLFACLGSLLVLRWRWLAWLHAPAAAWAALVELAGLTCPLTPLENLLRRASGAQRYDEGFVEHYLLPLLYPAELTRITQLWMGGLVVVVNLGLYVGVARSRRRPRGPRARAEH